jgi:hypothetical protein
MAESACPICNIDYDRNNRKAFILECGDSACSSCINFYKDSGKELECGKCCRPTKSLNTENKALYTNNSNQSNKPTLIPEKDEFEILIREKNGQNKLPIFVKKSMTVGELKEKIKKEYNIQPGAYILAFRKPLSDDTKTLESYKITKTVTVTMISVFDGGK